MEKRNAVKRLKTWSMALFGVKGNGIIDELVYLTDLIAGTFSRKILSSHLSPGYLAFRDFSVRARERENSIFYCPARTDAIFHIMPYYEKRIWEFMKSVVRPGDVVIDVGAHVGTYTIPIAHRVGASGTVISVEPSPISQILYKNVKMNGLKNCVIIKKAAWSRRTKLEFHYNLRRTGISSCAPKRGSYTPIGVEEVARIEVEAAPLDDMVKEMDCPINAIKLLKIDVEGGEVEVLKGATNILRTTQHVVFEASKEHTLSSCLGLLPKDFTVLFVEDRPTNNFIASRINH